MVSWEEFRQKMHVNKTLLPVKVWYFVFFSGVAVLLPYLSVFFRSIGLSASEVSIITGFMPFLGFIFRPLFGILADKINRHKWILMFCCASNGLVHMCLLLVPHVDPVQTSFVVPLNLSCRLSGVHACQDTIAAVQRRGNCNITSNTAYDPVKCEVTCSISKSDEVCLLDNVKMAPPSGNRSICDKSIVAVDGDFSFAMTIVDKSNFSFPETVVAIKTLHDNGIKGAYNASAERLLKSCPRYYINGVEYSSKKYESMTCRRGEVELDCSFKCDSSKCLKFSPDVKQDLQKTRRFGVTFWLTIFIVLIGHTLFSPCSSLTDGIAYDMLGEQHHLWGHQRLWGTIGFGLIAAMIGFVIDAYQNNQGTNNFSINMYLYGVIMVLTMFATTCLQVPEDFHCTKILKNVSRLFRYLQIVTFLCCVFMYGFLYASIVFYMFWHLEDLDASPLVLSLSITMTCVGEVPMLFLSGRIIKKVGEIGCLYIAFVAYILRLLGIAFLFNPWYILVVELLHGATFGLMYSAASTYAAKISPPGMSATLQGLVSGTHFGFGLGIGALVAGLVYDRWGGRVLFISEAILAATSLIVFMIVQNCFVKGHDIPTVVYVANGNDKRDDGTANANEKMVDNHKVLENGDATLSESISEPLRSES